MKVVIAFGFIMFCCSDILNAQFVPEIPSQIPFSVGSNLVKAFDWRNDEIRGTHLFLDTFLIGKIQFINDEQEKNMLLSYDALNDQVLVKRETSAEPFAIRKDVIERFIIPLNEYSYEFIRLSNEGTIGYFLRLVNGKVSFYCKVSKIIHVPKSDGDHYSVSREKEFLIRNQYFIQIGENSLKELQKSRKGIIQAFPEYKDTLSTIFKKNKVDFNDYTKMTKVFSEIEKLF
jgi:hypothetical protein